MKSLEDMHGLLLEALRSREQEVFKYLSILAPALAGFAWLIYANTADRPGFFIAGTVGVLLLLLLGALYSLALGYNYRYITLELAKIEARLGLTQAMLRGWPKKPKDFLKYRYCQPPEVIAFFWHAFLWGILFVTAVACALRGECCVRLFIGVVGIVVFANRRSLSLLVRL